MSTFDADFRNNQHSFIIIAGLMSMLMLKQTKRVHGDFMVPRHGPKGVLVFDLESERTFESIDLTEEESTSTCIP